MNTNLIGTDIDRAAAALAARQLVGIPTETVYGLAANALNPEAVAKIFAAKQRPSFDPLIVHLAHLDQLRQYARQLPVNARQLAESCWPGPLTLVVKRQAVIPDIVTSGLDTVALRLPRHPLTRALLAQLDFPLAAPSANPFGYISPTRPEHVAAQLGEAVAYILDGGPCEVGLESTIVSFAGPKPQLLRAGGYAQEELEQILGQPLERNTFSSSNPRAPGMLAQHYSPATPLRLAEAYATQAPLAKRIAYLQFRADQAAPKWATKCFALSDSGNLAQAAAQLFSLLRTLDAADYDLIVAEKVPEVGLGRAINDRLTRAAAR
ncbi:MAG: L-threonylcarbamoyladenylate synthase [Bacteroidota bacterium]